MTHPVSLNLTRGPAQSTISGRLIPGFSRNKKRRCDIEASQSRSAVARLEQEGKCQSTDAETQRQHAQNCLDLAARYADWIAQRLPHDGRSL